MFINTKCAMHFRIAMPTFIPIPGKVDPRLLRVQRRPVTRNLTFYVPFNTELYRGIPISVMQLIYSAEDIPIQWLCKFKVDLLE